MKPILMPLFSVFLAAAELFAQPRVTLGPEVVIAGPFARPVRAVNSEWLAPAFAAAGRSGDYLVAWSEFGAEGKASLVTAKLDSSGAVVAGTRHVAPPLRPFDSNAQFPAVAFDGERFLVVWVEGVSTVLVGMRFDRDGKPLDPVPFLVSWQSQASYVAATAANGEFIVSHSTNLAPSIVRIGPDGTVRNRDSNLLTRSGFWRDIESNGRSVFIATESTVYRPSCLIPVPFCLPVSNRGLRNVPLDARFLTDPPLFDGMSSPVPIGTGVATDGERYLVISWNRNEAPGQTGSFLRGQLTDTTGARFIRESVVARNPDVVLGEKQSGRIDAVWTGGIYAIVHEVFGPAVNDHAIDVQLTFAGPNGTPLNDPVAVATSAEQERSPVVLPITETRVLVLYERGTPGRPELVARTAGLSFKTRAIR